MCKHVLNAQVSVRAPCCKKWFDCPECHEEKTDHPLKSTMEMIFACKKCKKVFRKDVSEFEESDEYCPGCDNHYIIPAKTVETQGKLVVSLEGSDEMYLDDRVKRKVHDRDDYGEIEMVISAGTSAAPPGKQMNS